MIPKLLLSIFLLAAYINSTAQEKDIIRLLDAHDILYFNRLADSFYPVRRSSKMYSPGAADGSTDKRVYTEAERAAVLKQATEVAENIGNTALLRKTYPYAFAQFAMEYYGLKTIVSLSEPGAAYAPVMLQYLDSLNHYFKVSKTEGEIALLKKEAGIRWESLLETSDKYNLYSFATNPLNGLLHRVLQLKLTSPQPSATASGANDVVRLLDAHDLLLFSRTGGSYASASRQQTDLKAAEALLSGIKDTGKLAASFPALTRAYRLEHLYLQSLLTAAAPSKSEEEKLRWLEEALAVLLQPETFPSTDEIKRLEKTVGIRQQTVMMRKALDVDELILAYNTAVAQWLTREFDQYQKTKTFNPGRIDSLLALQKPYERSSRSKVWSENERQTTVDKTFLAAQQVALYFKQQQALQQNECEKILFYAVGYKLTQTLTSLDDTTLSTQLDRHLQKTVDSLRLSCATAALTATIKNDLEQQVWEWRQLTDVRPPLMTANPGLGLNNARFPFPPPEPSRRTQPLVMKGNPKTWQDADHLLMQALRRAHYNQVSYYGINGGFAVVTPLEQLQDNGAPKSDPPRYEVKVSLREEFSFSAYLKALFFGEKGFYRVMVFMFTNQPITSNPGSSGSTVLHLPAGLDRLPEEDARRPYTAGHRCTVLVYEFEKKKGDPAKFIKPGRFDVKTHLSRTLIWNDLFY